MKVTLKVLKVTVLIRFDVFCICAKAFFVPKRGFSCGSASFSVL